ncbi:unnamed protein product [Miscanthus lutarioriparius]|uniref:protein-serine/threonine phosphatase n=1 Tax=Miscanthus lutarioriparius TaxID=422564 RepID=A0A811MCW3_9POAL|nr:unnamed protein product [Miscanthus lutarioriparius]
MLRAVARCCCHWPPEAAGGGRDAVADGAAAARGGEFSMAAAQANLVMEDQAQVLASRPTRSSASTTDTAGPTPPGFAREQGGMSAEAIRSAFGAAEEEFHKQVRQEWTKRPRLAAVGSCCLLGAISGDTLYVANVGDSRAVLGRRVVGGGVAVAERLSTEHNAASEEVRRELAALNPDDAQIVVHARGSWRVKGIIQVSRSIGDFYLKKPEYSLDPLFRQVGAPIPLKRPALSAEPSVQVRKLKPNDLFLIFASDGLWEHLSDDDAVQIVFKNPRTGIANRLVKAALKEATRKREVRYRDLRTIDRGVRRHFHDDISVVVVYLDRHRERRHTRVIDSSSNCTSAPVDIYSNAHQSVEPLHAYKS